MPGEREQALEEAAAMLDEWVAADERLRDTTSADALGTAAICIRALKVPGATDPCACDGCPTQVPAFWRSGLCSPCANEDCEHDQDDELEVGHGG